MDADSPNSPRKFVVVVLGAGGVGKSALTVRFIRNEFVEKYDPTIEGRSQSPIIEHFRLMGLHLSSKSWMYVSPSNGEINFYVMRNDKTAGAEQFTSLNEMYIKTGHGFVLVFSLSQEASLREVDNLRQQIYRIKGSDTGVPIVVVGTKMDLTNEREVHATTIQSLAARWDLPFYESSAKRGWHVSDVFEDLVRQMRARYPSGVPLPRRPRRPRNKPCVIM